MKYLIYWQLNSPVAVDRDANDKQHGHDDSRDDDIERQIVLFLVLHKTDHPLPFAKLDLWINTTTKEHTLVHKCTDTWRVIIASSGTMCTQRSFIRKLFRMDI